MGHSNTCDKKIQSPCRCRGTAAACHFACRDFWRGNLPGQWSSRGADARIAEIAHSAWNFWPTSRRPIPSGAGGAWLTDNNVSDCVWGLIIHMRSVCVAAWLIKTAINPEWLMSSSTWTSSPPKSSLACQTARGQTSWRWCRKRWRHAWQLQLRIIWWRRAPHSWFV